MEQLFITLNNLKICGPENSSQVRALVISNYCYISELNLILNLFIERKEIKLSL